MRKIRTFSIASMAFILLFNPVPLAAQDAYEQAMSHALLGMDTCTTTTDYLTAAGQFERIAVAENERWLPWYYMAMNLILASLEEPVPINKTPLLDRGQEAIDQAMKLAPSESELHVLQAFLYPSYIMVDPMLRGMEGMEEMNVSLARARELNPENPRTYYLEGIQKLNLPPSMGGGAEVAKPLLKTALVKFDHFEAPAAHWPAWGESDARAQLEKISN